MIRNDEAINEEEMLGPMQMFLRSRLLAASQSGKKIKRSFQVEDKDQYIHYFGPYE